MPEIEEERSVRSEAVFEGKLFSVRKDTVELPGGRTTEREIVVHPEAVAVVPVLDDGRIVLVKQYRKPAERVLLELPAGGVDPGEDPSATVKREMVEETGYEVGSTTKVASFFTSPGYSTELMHLFIAEDLTEGRPTEETDHIEIELLTLEKALQRISNGEIADAKTILGIVMYRDGNGLKS